MVQEELDSANIEDLRALSALPHLNGCINEALRLLPAILTAISRNVPAEGIVFGKTFIAGGTKICAPRYSIGRCKSPSAIISWRESNAKSDLVENAFEKAHEFIPERWYSRPEMVKAPRAFAPFGMGKY